MTVRELERRLADFPDVEINVYVKDEIGMISSVVLADDHGTEQEYLQLICVAPDEEDE